MKKIPSKFIDILVSKDVVFYEDKLHYGVPTKEPIVKAIIRCIIGDLLTNKKLIL